MKKIFYLLFIIPILFTIGCHKKINYNNLTFEGIKVFNYEKPKGFITDTTNNEIFFYKNDVANFDLALMRPKLKIIQFHNNINYILKDSLFLKTYNDLIELIGRKEDINKDFIPSYDPYEPNKKMILNRTWNIKNNKHINLYYKEDQGTTLIFVTDSEVQ